MKMTKFIILISILFQSFNTKDWYQVLKKHINLQSVQLSDILNYPENCNYLINLLYNPSD